MKGWGGLVGWPVADGLPTLVVTHQLQVERRTGKVHRPETDVPPLCHATNLTLSLASVKSRLVLPFWYRLTRVVPDKGPLSIPVFVCVCVFLCDFSAIISAVCYECYYSCLQCFDTVGCIHYSLSRCSWSTWIQVLIDWLIAICSRW